MNRIVDGLGRLGALVSCMLMLLACSFATSPNVIPAAERVQLEADRRVEGLFRVDNATAVAYEYTWHVASTGVPERLDMRFDPVPARFPNSDLRLLVFNDEGRAIFTALLFESGTSTVPPGPRAFSLEPHRAQAFAIVTSPHAAPNDASRANGIALIEGERISGTFERWANTTVAVRYTYTYRRESAASAGVLDMEFELINGDVFSDMTLEVVLVDANREPIAGGLLFERRNRRSITDDVRAFRIEPYGAVAFDFVGGGFSQPGTPPRRF